MKTRWSGFSFGLRYVEMRLLSSYANPGWKSSASWTVVLNLAMKMLR